MRRRRPSAWVRRVGTGARVAVWTALVLSALVALGVALYTPRLGTEAARRVARRQLALELDAGEMVERSAFAAQRHWYDYYHETHGVLAATERRLIWVGVVPRGVVERGTADEPPAFDVRSWAYDSVTARRGRVFFGTRRGVILAARGGPAAPAGRDGFAVGGRQWAALQEVLRVTERRQALLRAEAERERQSQEYAAWLARQPVYHVVRRGEALSTLASQYNITPDSLRALNGITGDRIKIGQRLLVKPGT